MVKTNKECVKKVLTKYLLIYPFLFLVHVLDFLIGLILPYKYEDNTLPDKNAVLSARVDESDTKSPYRSTMHSDLVRIEDKNANLYNEFKDSLNKFSDMETMGVREVHSIEDELQSNGKNFKKYIMGQYKWSTYETVFERVNRFSNGLLNLGLKSNQNVVLFAETRPEWVIAAFSCFKIKVPIVTLYATLGTDALSFGINQTSASFVFTNGEQLPKLQKIIKKIANITHIIVFDDKYTEAYLNDFKKNCPKSISAYTMSEVEKIGAESEEFTDYKIPQKDDLAIIMYTSGSTGY
jgi:long-chain acyl-CoA synthetase